MTQQWENNEGIVQFQGTATNPTFHMHVGDQDRHSRDRCLDYFAVTDPRDVKITIHQTRGAALKESYGWILYHPQYQHWRNNNDSQVLWIKGDPGKGKTMLLCGIINELAPTTKLEDPLVKTFLSFFFCQATEPKLSNAHAVLRGLIYMLVDTQPSFLSHVRKKFKDTGEPRFGNAEAWAALCNIFLDILRDSSLDKIYIVVDALDECVQDQDKLLQFILRGTKEFPHVKWIISSRNHVEPRIRLDESQSILSLELQENAESVSVAIGAYISNRVAELESLQDDNTLLDYVQQTLQEKSEGTFLWVALVVQELEHVDSWDVRQVVDDIPTGLDDLYARMIDYINNLIGRIREYCQLVLSATVLAYRPLELLELGVVSGLPDKIAGNAKNIEKIVKRSGSFLTVRDKTVYFVHQSAKDYLIKQAGLSIFPSGFPATHRRMLTQSLHAMHRILRRDIYSLHALGTPIDHAEPPTPDPLGAVGYSCIYWVDHLEESVKAETLASTLSGNIDDYGAVDAFLRERYLYWLEALSLLRGMTEGILATQKLEIMLRGRSEATELQKLVHDAYRFIRYHRGAIEDNPLQAYGSALVFSPPRSLIRQLCPKQWLNNIAIAPPMGDDWDAHTGACLQTLEGHDLAVESVVFSHDSSRVASGSGDNTIKIWDAQTGACLHTLEGHDQWVTSVVFSHDSSRLASGSDDETIKIWDAHTGACLQTLDSWSINSVVFSHDSSRVASGSSNNTIKIWDIQTGACLQTLEGHSWSVTSVVFSHDSSRVASASHDKTIKIWDAQTGACLQTLEGHGLSVSSVVFSHDSSRVASGSGDNTIKIWDAHTGACLQTLEGHSSSVTSVVFSHDSSRVASGSSDNTIKIWDAQTGACLQTLEGHSLSVTSVVFSHDSSRVASASHDKTIKIWDAQTSACLQTLEGHDQWVTSVVFSHDSSRVASGSGDKTIKIWDAQTGACLQTLEGHSSSVTSVVFSHDSSRVASGSDDKTTKIWDAQTRACLRTLKGHNNWVKSVVFSHDSSRVASGSGDKTIKIWDAQTGVCLQTLEGHSWSVTSVVFSHDSSRVVSGSDDKTIKIWDAQTGACLQTLESHHIRANLSFDAPGSYLHTNPGPVRLHNLPTPTPTTSTDVPASASQSLSVTQESPTLENQGYGISSDGFWITRRSQNWLWLPPTYRPTCSGVGQSGLVLVLGCQSGRVLIFGFTPGDSKSARAVNSHDNKWLRQSYPG
ncbi:WD40-repeat-containing domain protein [Aspergillus floccosus]